jgi:signal transduction histidine kinase
MDDVNLETLARFRVVEDTFEAKPSKLLSREGIVSGESVRHWCAVQRQPQDFFQARRSQLLRDGILLVCQPEAGAGVEGYLLDLDRSLALAGRHGALEDHLALPRNTAFLFVDSAGRIERTWGVQDAWQQGLEGTTLAWLCEPSAQRAPQALAGLLQALQRGHAMDVVPLFLRALPGAPETVRMVARPQPPGQGPSHLLCVLDESDLWNALASALDHARSPRQLAASIPAPLLILDGNNRIEVLNDALAQLLGLPEGGLLQRPLATLERWARLPEGMLEDAITNALRSHSLAEREEGRPLRLRDDQGNPHWLVPAAAPVEHSDGRRILVLFTEVTRYEESQRLQVAEERDAALNLLSESILHDLNNVLTVISGASRLLSRPEAFPTAQKDLAAAVEGAKQLVARLRDRELGRPLRAEHHPADDALRFACEGFRATLPPRLTLTIGPLVKSGIYAPPVEFQRAVLNLLRNAAEAIEGPGEIVVQSHWSVPQERIEILVIDSGRGMVASEQARIFDAYFSTKTGNEDRGLGLTQVARMAASAGGGVRVESSRPGRTVLALELPAQPALFSNPAASGA